MSETNRPNVLLICTDHWPGSLLGCAGHSAVRTPTIDQIARNGVYFPNTYSECPVCIPARRTLMTSLNPHSHGMLSNHSTMTMPDVPTMAQCFRDAGYQATAVGKLHVYPQRDRIGFDEVILDEEGRGKNCGADDYEYFLADHGHAGQRYANGMNSNDYMFRPWHLEEKLNPTNWTAQQMARQIARRDPTKPGFWYMSFTHPHPPVQPLRDYLEMYRDIDVPDPHVGDWIGGEPDEMALPIHQEFLQQCDLGRDRYTPALIRDIRRAFYAMCTHIDHQIRVVIGALIEQRLMKDTIICFTADHGDMLGNHRLWAKHWMYEDSARVPMVISGTQQQSNDGTVGFNRTDERLVGWADVMPTLLGLAGIEPPAHCEGMSMFGEARRDHVYGAWGASANPEGAASSRMIRDERYKLIYYPKGNCTQLFDMVEDRNELHDLAGDPAHAETVARLQGVLIDHLRDDELEWLADGQLVGYPDAPRAERGTVRHFMNQRGPHYPPPR